jgi:hypothetical protein
MNDISEFLSNINLVPQKDKQSNVETNDVSNSISIEVDNCYIPSSLIAKYCFEKNIPIKTSKIEYSNYEKFCKTNIQLTIESQQKIKKNSNQILDPLRLSKKFSIQRLYILFMID